MPRNRFPPMMTMALTFALALCAAACAFSAQPGASHLLADASVIEVAPETDNNAARAPGLAAPSSVPGMSLLSVPCGPLSENPPPITPTLKWTPSGYMVLFSKKNRLYTVASDGSALYETVSAAPRDSHYSRQFVVEQFNVGVVSIRMMPRLWFS